MENLINIFGEVLYNEIVETKDLYKKSKMIVDTLFLGIKDKSGNPYLEHLYSVSSIFEGNDRIVALLHDTLEDTIITKEDLINLGYPNEIIKSLDLLTKKDNEKYDDFIQRIINSEDVSALRVKKADMENNMNEERMQKLSEDERNILNIKYKDNYKKIIDKVKEMEI